MKNIYILLMHTNTLPANLVKFFTRYKYSHVAVSLNEDCNKIYSFGRRRVHNIFVGGFTEEERKGKFFSYFDKTVCKIYKAEVSDEQYEKAQNIISNMNENKYNYKYDFLGIVPRFFGIPITRKDRAVCSSFVGDLLEKSDIYKFEKPACMLKPRDFESLSNFKEIYSGLYNT